MIELWHTQVFACDQHKEMILNFDKLRAVGDSIELCSKVDCVNTATFYGYYRLVMPPCDCLRAYAKHEETCRQLP